MAKTNQDRRAIVVLPAAAYARFVTESRANGARAAFAAERDKAAARIRQRLDTHVDDLVRIAHEDEVDRARAIQHLEALEPVVRAFDGDESADLVLRRLAAA